MELINLLLLGGIFAAVTAYVWLRYYSWKKSVNTVATVLEAAAIPSYRQSQSHINREISRVRRYQRALSVIAVKRKSPIDRTYRNGSIPGTNGHASSNGHAMGQMEFLMYGAIFRDALRETDIISYDGSNNLFLLVLPETSRLESLQTMDRLNKKTGGKIYRELEVGIAEFPEQGFIVSDLVENAILDAQSQQSVEARPVDSKANKNLN